MRDLLRQRAEEELRRPGAHQLNRASPPLEAEIKDCAKRLGFDLVGIAKAGPADHFERFTTWLDAGCAGEMGYLEKHREARRSPTAVFPSVRSIVMLGLTYSNSPAPPSQANLGRIARYAQGPDYHRFLWDRLDQLLSEIQRIDPAIQGRGVVDTAPLLERDFARRAGLGWFGKNTMLIDKKRGSYFLLAALLLDIDLQPDQAHVASHCGTCTACIDACPTNALTPGTLDARKCISYLTIELRGPVPQEHRSAVGDLLFGCDICQEVCPWNRKPTVGALPHDADLEAVDAREILLMSEEEFRKRFRSTAISRAKWQGLRRNAAIVLGNTGDESVWPMLRTLSEEEDIVIREAALWALKKIDQRRTGVSPLQ